MNLGLDHIRLRNKMLIIFFVSVFTPILLTNIIFYIVTTNHVENLRMKDINKNIEQMKSEFQIEVEHAISLSSLFYTDFWINKTLSYSYTNNEAEYVEAYNSYLRRVLNSSYTPIYTLVKEITIYVDNPTLLYSGGVEFISPEVEKTEWYKRIKKSNYSTPILIRTESSFGEKDIFSIVRRMDYYRDQNHVEKVLKIDLRPKAIEQIFSNLNVDGDLYLIEKSKRSVEYTTNSNMEWRNTEIIYDQIDLPKGTIVIEKDFSDDILLGQWNVIAEIPDIEVFQEVKESSNFVILLACLIIILPTLVIVWITRSFTVRLMLILKHINKVTTQNFEIIPDIKARDEIGQLSIQFNRMTLTIKSLIDDVYKADIQKKNLELQQRQAQLNALHSQINPHFLFNALETIRMRSLMKGENETANIIQSMAKMLRTSLVWKMDKVTVKQELELIYCFLEIQKYRFEQKLDYHIQIDSAAYDCTIPKMTYLTFIENASIHGIEPLKHGGRIDLKISIEENVLVYYLQDNGVGMKEEKLSQLNQYMHSKKDMGDRVGIQNVIYRLKLYYEEQFEMLIDSEEGNGTTIQIRLPIEKEMKT
ncbi:sensor histidine kinase [Chengkuizengella sp. SCS-71B]|uniref:sensor histidine kinase n=1 Tax=Chengkuizengella sp. SCS-71B TaxID=3115290 RepID=UPI0032C23973